MTPPEAAMPANAEAISKHIYPAGAMIGDYLRAAAGIVPTAALFATVPIGLVPGVILGGFGAVFAIFGVRTVLRHRTRIEMTDTGLYATGLWPRAVGWRELDQFKLAYYSTRRDRRSGWMQLELGSGRGRVSVDSRIEGFDILVRRAAKAAAECGVQFSEATAANLDSLGVRTPSAGDWP